MLLILRINNKLVLFLSYTLDDSFKINQLDEQWMM